MGKRESSEGVHGLLIEGLGEAVAARVRVGRGRRFQRRWGRLGKKMHLTRGLGVAEREGELQGRWAGSATVAGLAAMLGPGRGPKADGFLFFIPFLFLFSDFSVLLFELAKLI
jgi:hypothetical protein